MQDGLYKAEFQTPFGSGVAVMHLHDGHIHGGNSALYYVGTFKQQGQRFHAVLVTQRHSLNLNIASVFGVDEAHVHIEGDIREEEIIIEGFAEEVDDMALKGKLTFLSP